MTIRFVHTVLQLSTHYMHTVQQLSTHYMHTVLQPTAQCMHTILQLTALRHAYSCTIYRVPTCTRLQLTAPQHATCNTSACTRVYNLQQSYMHSCTQFCNLQHSDMCTVLHLTAPLHADGSVIYSTPTCRRLCNLQHPSMHYRANGACWDCKRLLQ